MLAMISDACFHATLGLGLCAQMFAMVRAAWLYACTLHLTGARLTVVRHRFRQQKAKHVRQRGPDTVGSCTPPCVVYVASYVVQATRCNACGASYVVRAMWCKLCGAS